MTGTYLKDDNDKTGSGGDDGSGNVITEHMVNSSHGVGDFEVSLAPGTSVSGHVIVDSGNINVTSLPALPSGSNVIGHVIVDSAPSGHVTVDSLPVGHNIIDSGSVAITSLPALPTGTNVIGHVVVDTLPVGHVVIDSGTVSVSSLPALPSGSNVIGHVIIDSAPSGSVSIISAPVVGTHGNAWNNTSAASGTYSASVDCQYTSSVSAFGNASSITTITLQYSQNNTNFYDGQAITTTGAEDFRVDAVSGARYHRLKTSAAATITASICGKG